MFFRSPFTTITCTQKQYPLQGIITFTHPYMYDQFHRKICPKIQGKEEIRKSLTTFKANNLNKTNINLKQNMGCIQVPLANITS